MLPSALCAMYSLFLFFLFCFSVCCLSAPACELQGICQRGNLRSQAEVMWGLKTSQRFTKQDTWVNSIFLDPTGRSLWALVCGCHWPQRQQISFSHLDAEKQEILDLLWDQRACPSLVTGRRLQLLFSIHLDLLLFSLGD